MKNTYFYKSVIQQMILKMSYSASNEQTMNLHLLEIQYSTYLMSKTLHRIPT